MTEQFEEVDIQEFEDINKLLENCDVYGFNAFVNKTRQAERIKTLEEMEAWAHEKESVFPGVRYSSLMAKINEMKK